MRAGFDHRGAAGRERHPVAKRLVVEGALGYRSVERDPYVVPPRRPRGPALAGEMPVQGGHERIAALAVVRQGALELAIVVARREVAGGDVLVQRAGVDVRVHLQRGQATEDRTARGNP